MYQNITNAFTAPPAGQGREVNVQEQWLMYIVAYIFLSWWSAEPYLVQWGVIWFHFLPETPGRRRSAAPVLHLLRSTPWSTSAMFGLLPAAPHAGWEAAWGGDGQSRSPAGRGLNVTVRDAGTELSWQRLMGTRRLQEVQTRTRRSGSGRTGVLLLEETQGTRVRAEHTVEERNFKHPTIYIRPSWVFFFKWLKKYGDNLSLNDRDQNVND